MRLPQSPGATRRGFVPSAKRTGMVMVLPGVAVPSRNRHAAALPASGGGVAGGAHVNVCEQQAGSCGHEPLFSRRP